MSDELRDLRHAKNMPAGDMVAVVQQLYPKYDKTMQSKCENGAAYGVDIRADALEALYLAFAPELLEQRRRRKNSGHRLTCRISARLADGEYGLLQQHIHADGYATMQDWITDIVRAYLAGKEAGPDVE